MEMVISMLKYFEFQLKASDNFWKAQATLHWIHALDWQST